MYDLNSQLPCCSIESVSFCRLIPIEIMREIKGGERGSTLDVGYKV
jgi:hypothetical protein